MSTAKNFLIYEDGLLKNEKLLNSTGKIIFDIFKTLNEKKYSFFDDYGTFKDVKTIRVTSQKRDWGGQAHIQNKAIDIQIQPEQYTPFIFAYIYKLTNLNVFISLHNKHIHCDSLLTKTRNHLKGAEKKNANGEIDIYSISENIADEICSFYISSIPNSILIISSPIIYNLKYQAFKLVREKVTTEEVMDNQKKIRGEKPSYFQAFFGLGIFITSSALLYFLYKKKKNKKEVLNESRKEITRN